MAKAAIIILNYNGQKHLEKFLPSVIKHSTNGAIIIADNGSTDNSVSWLKDSYPEVGLIEFKENHGFCGGYNRAIRFVDCEYAILLNNDIEVTKDWLPPLIEQLDKEEKLFAIQPKILSYREPEKFEHAGAGGGFIDKFGYPFCRGRIFDHVENDEGQYNDLRNIFWATGACMAVKKKLFLELGGLDEDFFAHMEEIDLCWRAWNKGYKVAYNGKSKIYHLGGGTLSYDNPGKVYLNFRNNLAMLIKNLSSLRLFGVLIFRIIFDFVAGLKYLFEGKNKAFKSIFRAYWHVLTNYQSIKKKRLPGVVKNLRIPGIYTGSIVFQFFIFGKKQFRDLNID